MAPLELLVESDCKANAVKDRYFERKKEASSRRSGREGRRRVWLHGARYRARTVTEVPLEGAPEPFLPYSSGLSLAPVAEASSR
jgi:hypothetical protein